MMIRAVVSVVAVLLPALAWAQATPQAVAPSGAANEITTVNASRSLPARISAPASIGTPHDCGSEYYPRAAIVLHMQGETTLAYRIATDGSVKDLTVLQSSGSKYLDDAAMECAATWHYKPATQDGRPVEVAWRARINWSLGRHANLADAITPPVAIGPQHVCDKPPGNSPAAISGPRTTVLAFDVDADGNVKNVRIKLSSGDESLDQYGSACVAAWRFSPAIVGRVPISVTMSLKLSW